MLVLSTWIGWQGHEGSSCKVLMLLSKHHFTKMVRINGQVVKQRLSDKHSYVQFKRGMFCMTRVAWLSAEDT